MKILEIESLRGALRKKAVQAVKTRWNANPDDVQRSVISWC